MKISIFDNIKIIGSMLHISAETPEQILKVLGIFEDLLSDNSNFIDPEKWGSKINKKEVVPFSFSEKGLSKIENLKNKFPAFKHVYKGGIAGISNEFYSLIYFISQFLVAITSYVDSMEFRNPKNNKEKEILENLKNKYKKIDYRVNTRELYNKIPRKPHSKEEYKNAKQYLLNIIGEVKKDYKKLDNLSEEEKDLVLSH